jgi:RNA polymerase sigma-70 factor, ECF subfamily
MVAVMEVVEGVDADATGLRTDFVALYRSSLGEVYSYFASRAGGRSVAEDLTQEVFIAGARRHAAGGSVDMPWLIAVARHKLVEHWRRVAREDRKLELVQAAPAAVDEGDWVVDPGVGAEALAALNATYRAALVLRHVDGLPVPAVAQALGRTVAATEQVLSRARAAFRQAYEERVR